MHSDSPFAGKADPASTARAYNIVRVCETHPVRYKDNASPSIFYPLRQGSYSPSIASRSGRTQGRGTPAATFGG